MSEKLKIPSSKSETEKMTPENPSSQYSVEENRRLLADLEAHRSETDLASSQSHEAVNDAMRDRLINVARDAVNNAYISNEDMAIFNYNAPEGLKQDVFAGQQGHQMDTEAARLNTEIGLRETDTDKLATINNLKAAQLEAASIETSAHNMGRSDIVAEWANNNIDASSQNLRPGLNRTDTVAAWENGNADHQAASTRSITVGGESYDANRTPLAH